MKHIIMAGGKMSRWNNYLDTYKHLAPVPYRGEVVPLLDRTLSQISERDDGDIVCIVHDDKRYRDITDKYGRCTSFLSMYEDGDYEAQGWYDWTHLWPRYESTIIYYGDVYFTDDAMDQIIGESDYIERFARLYASGVTGTAWGEFFALRFMPEAHEQLYNAINDVLIAHKNGELPRSGSWEIWSRLEGWEIDEITIPPKTSRLEYHCEINDLTDDIDYPEDYDRLMKAIQCCS